ncbi:hypothetical protein AMK59_361, partial [Oryctes borbonicus]
YFNSILHKNVDFSRLRHLFNNSVAEDPLYKFKDHFKYGNITSYINVRCDTDVEGLTSGFLFFLFSHLSIFGLERIAEELMGRRKWKLYQESTSRNYLQPLNNNVKKIGEVIARGGGELTDTKSEPDIVLSRSTPSVSSLDKDELTAGENSRPNSRREEEAEGVQATETGIITTNAATTVVIKQEQEAEDRLKDWSPQSKCYFCVDGKLDSDHNNHGVLCLGGRSSAASCSRQASKWNDQCQNVSRKLSSKCLIF